MVLPNADRAEVDIRKLRDYCLSTSHPVGKHKAIVFRAALGLTECDADFLRNALLRAALTEDAVAGVADEFGARFHIDSELITAIGTAVIRSAWIVRTGEDFPPIGDLFHSRGVIDGCPHPSDCSTRWR